MQSNKLVTILVPNYKTPEITKICLRLLRKHTDFSLADVVIDNGSEDFSIAYLKSLRWITLLQRAPAKDDTVALSHSRALDLALDMVKTPYVISIHTDTFVKDKSWLDVLLKPFESDPQVAGVGSWKLESKSKIRVLGIQIEGWWKKKLSDYFGYKGYRQDRFDPSKRYLRSHCAVYKTEVIKKLNTSFSDESQTAGSVMHRKMVDAGYKMVFLKSAELGQFVDHINHATMILNPSLGTGKKNLKEGRVKIKKILRGIDANAILANDQLDE